MTMLFSYIRRELFNHRRFSLFFIFNLAIGLSGLVTVDSIKHSIESALQSKAKGILAADLGVGARRPLLPTEAQLLDKIIPQGTEVSRVFESFTMLASPTNNRLVELKAIEENYPFYGDLELKNGGKITSETKKSLFQSPSIWAYPELLIQLDLKLGDTVKIGALQFTITDVVERDSSGVGAGFSFAPPVYIARSYFEQSGLLQPGSTGYFSQLYRLPENTDLTALVKILNENLTDPAIQVTTSQNASEQVGRALGYVSDYLGLAGLVALFLMSLGQIFLYRNYLGQRLKDIAILKTLGLPPARVFLLYLLQVILLSLLALIPTLTIAHLAFPFIEPALQSALQIEFSLVLHFKSLTALIGLALFCQVMVLMPLLVKTLYVRPKLLLQPTENQNTDPLWRQIIHYTPALLGFCGLSIWLAKSFKIGLLFFSLLLISIGALYLFGFVCLHLFAQQKRLPYAWRIIVRNLNRSRVATLSAFVTLGLGVLLANLIPQLKSGLLNELATPTGLEQPSLFLFDIQHEQHVELKDLLQKENIKIMNSSPMIRARLNTINGQPFEKRDRNSEALTREEENENRFRNRGFNLTYRNALTASEKIIQGQPFSKNPSLPEISLEKRFADRLKINIGDVLEFDLQGVFIQGQVVNFRKVRWTSFQPNFFIQFQNGALEDSPQTHLITVSQLPPDQKIKIQNTIVKQFPNVSILDVSKVVDRLSSILQQMSFALQLMSFFCMFVGLVILFVVCNHQMQERKKDINLLKVLGAEFSLVRKILLSEFLLITLAAALAGTFLSFVLSFILSWQLFDSAWVPPLIEPLAIFAILFVVAFVLVLLVVQNVLRSRPRELLQSY